MNIEEFRAFCLKKKEVTEGFPFDNDTLVFKVKGKMFALAGIEKFEFINLKCFPEEGQELKNSYPEITGAYHMSKTHWMSVSTIGSLTDSFIQSLIDRSYELVVATLTKKLKADLDLL